MNRASTVALDANILLRGALGNRTSDLLERFGETVAFCAPEICFADAGRHILRLAEKRRFDPAPTALKLSRLVQGVRLVQPSDYQTHEAKARARIIFRDVSDWPIVATCLLLNAPLWTEDRDFFGCGIATWTTNTVGIYLQEAMDDFSV